VYGLGVDARDPSAIAALLALKGRDAGRGISVLVSSLDRASSLLASAPPKEAEALALRFWPGPLTIVLPAAEGIDESLLGPSGGVGLRCSSDPWAAALVARHGGPVTSTSANASGEAAARNAEEVRRAFPLVAGAKPSLFILDGGERRGSEASTVVEFAKGRATLLRRGAIDADLLADCLADFPAELVMSDIA
jgi:L-threonylcarbamoyladenylate synthase